MKMLYVMAEVAGNRENKGKHFKLFPNPVTHKEGCILLSKTTKYTWRRVYLSPIN